MIRDRFNQCPPAGLFKQLIAMLYDSFLIIALLFVATAVLLPFSQGEAVSGPIFSLYLLFIIFIFYGWFWHKAGQTLGMKVWKIRIIDDHGYNPSWPTIFIRLFAAILLPALFITLNSYLDLIHDAKTLAVVSTFVFLLGYLIRLFSPATLHDRMSQTRIIDVSKIPLEPNKQA